MTVDILDPTAYGLPARFTSFREQQLDILKFILRPEAKPYIIVSAPTGVGKSLIAATLAQILQVRTYIVVGTKALQDQYQREFDSIGLRTVKGKDGFPCVIEPGLTAGECKFEALTGKARDCPAYKACPYFMQRDAALKAKIVCTNYAYATVAWNYTETWGRAGLIVFDECDQAEGWLSNMVKLRFSHRDFADYGLEFPGESLEEVKAMIAELEHAVAERVAALKKLDVKTASKEDIVSLKRATRLQQRLRFYHEVYQPNWLFKREAKRDKKWWAVEFEPIWSTKFGKMLWSHGDRCVFMSATPGSKEEFCFKLGLDPDDVDFIEVPSPFDVENRKIVYWPVGDMSMKNWEANLPQLVEAVDTIIGERLDQKGVIHTSSYRRAQDIARRSQYAPYMMLVGQGDDKTELLARFKNSAPPRVLVSPVHGRGIDLPDDEARYAIIPSVLWPDLGDEKVKRRMEERPSWYPAQAVDAMVQASGRIVRSTTDWGQVYVLDSQLKRLLRQNFDLFPLWWVEALYELTGRTTEQASSTRTT